MRAAAAQLDPEDVSVTTGDASSDPLIAFFGRWCSVVTALAAIAPPGVAHAVQILNALLTAQGSDLTSIKGHLVAMRSEFG